MHSPQYRYGLAAQGYQVVAGHFHAFRRNAPQSVIKINFPPFGVAQFAGAAKRERHKLQGAPHNKSSGVVVQGNQQIAHGFRRGLRRQVSAYARGKRAFQIRRRVALGAAGSNGVAENARTDCTHTMRYVPRSPRFDFSEYRQYFRRGNCVDGF